LKITMRTCRRKKPKNQIRTQRGHKKRFQNGIKTLRSFSRPSSEAEDRRAVVEDEVEMEDEVLKDNWRKTQTSEEFSSNDSLITDSESQSTEGRSNAEPTTDDDLIEIGF